MGTFSLEVSNPNTWTGAQTFDNDTILRSRTDANRGAAATAGRIIFNTDDAAINVDDGTNWTDAQGTNT